MSTIINRLARACEDYLAAAVNHPQLLIDKPLEGRDFPRGIDRVWEAIGGLASAGRNMSPENIVAEMERQYTTPFYREDEQADDVFLTELFTRIPSYGDGCFAWDRVTDLSRQAAIIYASEAISKVAHDEAKAAEEKMASIESILTRAGDHADPDTVETLGEAMDELMAMLELAAAGKAPEGIMTGFDELDLMTKGFKPGELIVVAGRPGMGKTALLSQIVRHVTEVQGKRSMFLSLEMPKLALCRRMAASELDLPLDKQFDPNNVLSEKIPGFASWLKDHIKPLPYHIDDKGGLTLAGVRARAERTIRRFGPVEFIAIDYLQLMKGEGYNRQTEIGSITRGLKDMAKELKTTICVGAQLSRKGEELADRRPQLSHLRESGDIEQDADFVLMLHREEYYDPAIDPGAAEFLIRKHRNGSPGIVKVGFEGKFVRFTNNIAHRMPDYKGPSPFEGPQSPPPKRTIGDLFKKV